MGRLFRLWLLPLIISVCLLTLVIQAIRASGASLATAPDVAWSDPAAKSLHNLGPVNFDSLEREDGCTPITYRLIDDLSKTMYRGCFTASAFGLVDGDHGVAIFTGTDEAEPINYGGGPAALSIIPYSATVGRFGGFPGLGTYLYLYNYFPNALTEGGNPISHRFKQVSMSADFALSDSQGQPLAINPQAFAYAARGQWLVTEAPNHALVRINLATFSILPFAPAFTLPSNPYASHKASVAITEDGRYAAVASDEFTSFKVYDLLHCTLNGSDPLAPQHCPSHDYYPYVSSQVPGTLRTISHVNFVTDKLLSFQANNSSVIESYMLAPSEQITSLIPYLGVGDSYASGQGAWDYLAGTDTAINQCHLSIHSYPLRLSRDLFGNQGHSVACSGARIHDIGDASPTYSSQTSDQRSAASRQADGSEVSIMHDFTPGYLAQQTFVTSYQPGVITVQIGGNDVGFGDMLLRCVSPLAAILPTRLNTSNCYQSYEDRLEIEQTITSQYSHWVSLFKQLRRASPESRLYTIGYPYIATSTGSCSHNVRLTLSDIDFAHDVTNYLNGVILKASGAAGVQYIDISQALAGHELCSGTGTLAVNGLTAGSDALGVLGQESYHPTAYGHELIEQAIMHATHNLADNQPASNPAEPAPLPLATDTLLQAPKTGRTVRRVTASSNLTASRASRGHAITLHLQGSSSGTRSTSSYVVQLGDTLNIGSLQSDASGTIVGSVTLPPDSPVGPQPISLTGPGPDGDPITIVQVIYVAVQPDDYDGDGQPNAQDSCPLVTNSDIDEDGDDVDDACDSTIDGIVGPTSQTTPAIPTTANQITQAELPVALQSSTAPAAEQQLSATTKLTAAAQPLKTAKPVVPVLRNPARTAAVAKPPINTFWWFLWLIGLLLLLVIADWAAHQALKEKQ